MHPSQSRRSALAEVPWRIAAAWARLSVASVLAISFSAFLVRAQSSPANYADYDIERLLNLEVVSASKRQEPLFRSPSAIFVITSEDIRRSGAANLPDLLRMVPGIHVAQVDSYGWAISARGFAERYANKLLVLVDGRTVYNPLFSGVYWDAQSPLLEDVERIEVIRGPGATLWGANAVNGVISILTRSSQDARGGLATAGSGSMEPVRVAIRYGAGWGDEAAYRIFGSYFRRDHSVDAAGGPIADAWETGIMGFRSDWLASASDSLVLQGELLRRGADEAVQHPVLTAPFQQLQVSRERHWAGNALLRWNHRVNSDSDWSLQAYYDHADRHTQELEETLRTVDMDFHHHLRLGRGHEWVWGLGYRTVVGNFRGSPLVQISDDTQHLFSAFWQDEITVARDRFHLIPGVKVERAGSDGWNTQPSLRILWMPWNEVSLWAAVSRALRTPSLVELSSRINHSALPGPDGSANLVSIFGNQDFQSEKLLAYELGYRWAPRRSISLDLAAFYNLYEDLQTAEPSGVFFEADPPPPHLVIAQQFENRMSGESYGVELSANWSPARQWNFSAAYSWLDIQLHPDPGSQDRVGEQSEGASPEHQLHLRSHWSLPRNLALDVSWHYTAELESLAVPSYHRLDAMWTWNAGESASISLGGQNLLTRRHPEFAHFRQFGQIGQAERNLFLRLRWQF